ncbi:cobalamin biosynthesis protein CbiX [Acidovorax carolinensis]|uniref:Cobalamin biosynthesis protein CbiX n=1 Tax=Acidovorax carolinensis TaxID=553814 RepID=A0A240UBV3_9BURK|nr:CbiX/SirB N-terminal domain-containing protein [Acidovorax carolinensis]ART55243.1 cobalamin biosynthesis protein CbiX [Acidovorax carolinensis]ART58968.1 cobalamin biosynthesis protein CbiX [Acidovorax carolinensis]
MSEIPPAIVLFSHGSRDPLWRAPIEAVAERIASQCPDRPVECAYLELCEPTLAQAAELLVQQGATRITVVPMFLGTGKHAREDLPLLVEQLRSRHKSTQFTVQHAIGEDSRMTALMAEIACDSSTPSTNS